MQYCWHCGDWQQSYDGICMNCQNYIGEPDEDEADNRQVTAIIPGPVQERPLHQATPTAGRQTMKAIETRYNGYHFRSRLEARWAVFFDSLNIPYRYEPEGYDLEGLWYLPDFYLPRQRYYLDVKGTVPTSEDDTNQSLEKISKFTHAGWENTPDGDILVKYRVFVLWGNVEHPTSDTLFNANVPKADTHGIALYSGSWNPRFCWIECPFCEDFHIIQYGNLLFNWCDKHPIPEELHHYYMHQRSIDNLYESIFEERKEQVLHEIKMLGQEIPEELSRDLAANPFNRKPSWDIRMKTLSLPPSRRLRMAYAAAKSARFEHGETPK
jgi:hypothetical protein